MNYWLMKTEPSTFGIDHLANKPKKTAMWDGVRNYQARNMLRDDFRKGDQAFIYHSSAEETGIAGIMQVVRTAYPDPTQFDKKNDHYDPEQARGSALGRGRRATQAALQARDHARRAAQARSA